MEAPVNNLMDYPFEWSRNKDFSRTGNGPRVDLMPHHLHRPAGIFNFMLDWISDIEFDGLVDLIPKLSSTLL